MITQLIADVLDEQLVDKHGRNAGRVDGIILAWQPGRPPVVAFVEVSPITLVARFNVRLAQWYAGIDRRFGPGRGVPFRFEWKHITRERVTLRVDVDAEATPINAVEVWLRKRIFERMLGR